MSESISAVMTRLDADFDAAVERLCDLLRIKSVSTDHAYDAETKRAAEFLATDLRSIGFDAKVRPTTGHPMVVGHFTSATNPNGPRALYYGHYDVQPPDPIELWDTGPFEPTIVEGPHGKRIVARGAVDDKGQVMTFIEAFRAWKNATGTLPINVTVLLEGEEESGSPSLNAFLEATKNELAADVCVASDTGMWDIDTPAITYMLRGLLYLEITLHGPSHDLHSGMYGGSLVNPINALCSVIAALKDKDGRIQVPGFYDDVRELGPREKQQWANLGFDEAEFLASAGMKTPYGEAERTTLERIWSRPTCDVNGIWGGYTGEGGKTVIASKASAKLSFRLVADQDPEKIRKGFETFLKAHTPPDCRWEIKQHGGSPAIRVPTESPFLEAAERALKATYDKQPVLIGTGGSIPVVGSIQRILGFDSLLIGFGLDDDRVHSPNEKFELRCFEMGCKAHARLMGELAMIQRAPRASVAAGRPLT